MAIDWKAELEQLKHVDLDIENIGAWPALIKWVFAIVVALLAGFLVYYMVISNQIDTLEAEKKKELELRQKYQVKYGIAINVEIYREQLKTIEFQFQSMLKQLPTRQETAALLDDMTFVGTANGLRFDKLEWQPEREQEIYIELPMALEVVGEYHQLGQFVSDVAGLSRIISLDDFSLKNADKDKGKLTMDVQARTYRYKEAEQ